MLLPLFNMKRAEEAAETCILNTWPLEGAVPLQTTFFKGEVIKSHFSFSPKDKGFIFL